MTHHTLWQHNTNEEDMARHRFEAVLAELPNSTQLRIKSLPLLNNVSTQLLRILTMTSPQTLANTILGSRCDTAECRLFHSLLDLLEQVKLIYGDVPLLTVYDVAPGIWFPGWDAPSILRGFEQSILTTIRKCNLATFMLTLLGKFDYGFQFLNDCFIEVFCPSSYVPSVDLAKEPVPPPPLPPSKGGGGGGGLYSSYSGSNGGTNVALSSSAGGKLLKTHTVLYLNLKTQAYIAAISDTGVTSDRKQVLDALFPQDMAAYLKNKSGESANDFQLTPSERDFITRCQRRRETLEANTNLHEIMQLYKWSDFLKELLAYVSKNIGLLVFGKRGRGVLQSCYEDSNDTELHSLLHNSRLAQATSTAPQLRITTNCDIVPSTPIRNTLKPVKSASRTFTGSSSNSPSKYQDRQDQSHVPNGQFAFEGAVAAAAAVAAAVATTTATATPATPATVATTTTTTPKPPPNTRKKPQQKRMWVKGEEEALISALKVHGPSWSKILELHGAGGSISETLKNRTQVQLKDKARNWKMHYLKNGITVPYYLLKVTGNLEREERFKKRSKAKRKAKETPSNHLNDHSA